MTVVIFLKMAADLGFYFTFAGFFAMLANASGTNMLLSMFIMSLSVTLSYALREKGRVRFLPLVLCALCALIPGTNVGGLVVLVLPALYCAYVMAKELYVPEWDKQTEVFSVYWKIFFVFIPICLLVGKSQILYSFIIPCGVVTLTCLVLLMRSLRHERDIYASKRYQLMNLGIVLAVGIVGLFLSSNLFLSAVVAVLKLIYDYVISPILMVVIYVILAVIKVGAWLVSFIKINISTEEQELNLNLSGSQEIFKDVEEMGLNSEAFDRIALAVGLVLAVIIAILLFRYLSRRNGDRTDDGMGSDVRYGAEPAYAKTEEPDKGTPVQKVRAQYKRFLRFCRNEGIVVKKSDTSLDVNYQCSGTLPKEETGELRSIYLEARYNGKATKEDAARAKELYGKIKRADNK